MSDSQPTTAGNSEDQLNDAGDSFSSSPNTTPPPRADEIDQWQCHIGLQEFGQELQAAANKAFPNIATSRYTNVYVLLLSWEDEDPNLPVSLEISNLFKVFKNVYGFKTEIWHIPDQNCHAEVCQKILDFAKLGGNSKEDLKIVYYAGHGKLARNRLLSWTSWRNRSAQKAKCPTVKWSGIQNILEEAQSDVLLLLDCCNAGTANTNEGEGVTELISACAWNSTANGVGPYSFTNALVIELQDLAKKPSFSTGELYSNIFSRIQGRMPENGMERHPAPVHLVLTNDTHFPRSIQLSKRPISEGAGSDSSESTENSVHSEANPVDLDDGGSLRVRGSTMSKLTGSFESSNQNNIEIEGHHRPILRDKVPRLAFAVRLRDNLRVGDLSTDLFLEWLRHIPTIADQVKVEAGFDSFSSLLIISIPLSFSGYLPPDRAVISLGPIRSSNLILRTIQVAHPGLSDYETEAKNGKRRAVNRSVRFPEDPPSGYSSFPNPITSSPWSKMSAANTSSSKTMSRAPPGPPDYEIEPKQSIGRRGEGSTAFSEDRLPSYSDVKDVSRIASSSPSGYTSQRDEHRLMSQTALRSSNIHGNVRREANTLPSGTPLVSSKDPVRKVGHEIVLYSGLHRLGVRSSDATIWHYWVDEPNLVSLYSGKLGAKLQGLSTSVVPVDGVTEEALRSIITAIPGHGGILAAKDPTHRVMQRPKLTTESPDHGLAQLLDLAIALWEYDCSLHRDFQDFAERVGEHFGLQYFNDYRSILRPHYFKAWKRVPEDHIYWMFIALVFDWQTVFRIESMRVIENYDPLVKNNKYLPADFRELVDEMRKQTVIRTYNRIRDGWISLLDPINLHSPSITRMYLRFKRNFRIDLRKVAPEDLYKQTNPHVLLREFEDLVRCMEVEVSQTGTSKYKSPQQTPEIFGSASMKMAINAGFRASKEQFQEGSSPPEPDSDVEAKKQVQLVMLADLLHWRAKNLFGIPIPDSKFAELRNKHIQQPISESKSPGSKDKQYE